jgi:hypothetical protein
MRFDFVTTDFATAPAGISTSPPDAKSPARRIDPRGHRFGGGLSTVILGIVFLAQAPILVLAIGLALGVSAAFGTRYSILGRPWPYVRRALRIGPPAELEGEYPPRFAQAFGAVVLTFALILFAAGASVLAGSSSARWPRSRRSSP